MCCGQIMFYGRKGADVTPQWSNLLDDTRCAQVPTIASQLTAGLHSFLLDLRSVPSEPATWPAGMRVKSSFKHHGAVMFPCDVC
jgi:hypothetical protein